MKVALFIPCLTDQFFPESGLNVARVLRRLGVEVSYDPRQTCCGQPAFNTGYHHEALAMAKRFIDLFENAEYIVSPSGSCTTMAKVFYGELQDLPDEYRRKAESLRPRLFEFTEFLVDLLKVVELGARFNAKVTVHDSCHALRELHIKNQLRVLLQHVAGLELIEMEQAEVCCGFGGTFAVKHAEISTAMVEEKVESIIASGADVVTGVDSSCLMNIQGMLSRKGSSVVAMHIADILAAEGGRTV